MPPDLATVERLSTEFSRCFETFEADEVTIIARRLWLCEVLEGRITEAIGYCNGGWDGALRIRQAAEAPMVCS
jgi:hypothetical protein